MIKICFVTTVSITIKSFLIDLEKFMIENNDLVDITFICSPDDSLNEICNERVHYIPVPIKRGVGFDGIKVISNLSTIFKKENFDIIQYSTPNAAFYASIAAKKAGCNNRLYCQWGIRYMGFDKGIKRNIFKMVEKITCNNSTIIESESNSLYEFSVEENLYPRDKASVVWNGSACGVNLKKYDITSKEKWNIEIRKELGIPKDAVVFGYAGRITKDKGINELFKAFKKIEETEKAYLLMIGTFDNEGTIETEIKDWALKSKCVKFVDWTSCIEKYYSAMDVFCSLSYREGFGLVVIEAAAMGLPGIVTNVPGQKDTIEIGNDGWIVPDKNIDCVANTMKHCIHNIDEVRKYGVNARSKVENQYDQEKLFYKLMQNRIRLVSK